MATSKFTLSPVQKADLPTLAALIAASKLSLTINRLLFTNWPNHAAQKPLYTAAIEGGFANPDVTNLKAVDESGKIMAYLGVTRKRAVEAEEMKKGPAGGGVPDGMVERVLKEVMRAVGEVEKGNPLKGKDYYEVTFICVTPTSQRQGVGRQLMQVAFEKAKEEDLPIVVCSEPAAHDFFEILGFKETKYAEIDLAQLAPKYSGFGTFRLTGMIWEP